MLQNRRRSSLRRTLCVEVLEDRTLLTGNVMAVQDATGLLTLTGDTQDNAVVLAQVPGGLLSVNGQMGTTVNGLPSQNFNSVSALNIQFFDGNNSVAFDGVSTPGIPGPITIVAGTGNNMIALSNATFQRADITVGRETNGAVGRNTVDVSFDLITGSGIAGNVNVSILNQSGLGGKKIGGGGGIGPGSVNTLTMNNLQFIAGGSVNNRVDDGVVYFDPGLNALTPASTVQMANITTTGNISVNLGDHFQNEQVTNMNAGILTSSVGNDVDLVVVTGNISKSEAVTVGNVSTYPIPPLPPPSVFIGGTVGTMGMVNGGLTVNLGSNNNLSLPAGWPTEVTENITGGPLLIKAGNGDAVTVDPTFVGGFMDITMGNGGVNAFESLTLADCTSTDPNIRFNSNPADTVNINFTNLKVTNPNAILYVTDTGRGKDVVTLSNVKLTGFLFMILSNSGRNVVNARNVKVAGGLIFGGYGIGDQYHDLGGNSGYGVGGFP
jgi:hypothetical protein